MEDEETPLSPVEVEIIQKEIRDSNESEKAAAPPKLELENIEDEIDENNNNLNEVQNNISGSPNRVQLPPDLDEWIKAVIHEYNKRATKCNKESPSQPLRFRSVRDLADGFFVALLIMDRCPDAVSAHNVPRCNNREQKLKNWDFLSWRVLAKIGFKLEKARYEAIVDLDVRTLINFIAELKRFLDKHYEKKESVSMSSTFLANVPVGSLVPPELNSPRSKKPMEHIPNFAVLDSKTKKALKEKESLLIRNRKCVEELQNRFAALQGQVQERNTEIESLTRVQTPQMGKFEKEDSGCCLLL